MMQVMQHIHMDDGNLHVEILRLEAHIDELTEVIESCRKVTLVSKVAIERNMAVGLHVRGN
jgi:hypothetical protein